MIVAIITIFNPVSDVVDNIEKVCNQVDKVYLVDNSPLSNAFLFSSCQNATYVFNDGLNLGLPLAINRVLTNTGYEWNDNDFIIFFDQDSVVVKGQVSGLVRSFISISQNNKIGAIGAAYTDINGKLEVPHFMKKLDDCCYIVQDIITSSLLTKYGILKEIGFWNNDLFLDGSDWDLCWRMRDKDYICVLRTDIPFCHSVGKGFKRIFFFKLRDSAPIRSYYKTRDNLYLLTRRYTPRYLKFRLCIDILFVNSLRVVFLDGRLLRFKYIMRGFKDFLLNKTGEFC